MTNGEEVTRLAGWLAGLLVFSMDISAPHKGFISEATIASFWGNLWRYVWGSIKDVDPPLLEGVFCTGSSILNRY
jgi:hypothetical protein